MTVAVWLPSSSLLAWFALGADGEGDVRSGACCADRLLALEMQSVSLWLRRAMESGLTGASLLLGQARTCADGLLKWDGDVKPEVRSECFTCTVESRVNTWVREQQVRDDTRLN